MLSPDKRRQMVPATARHMKAHWYFHLQRFHRQRLPAEKRDRASIIRRWNACCLKPGPKLHSTPTMLVIDFSKSAKVKVPRHRSQKLHPLLDECRHRQDNVSEQQHRTPKDALDFQVAQPVSFYTHKQRR